MKRCSYCGAEYPDDATECAIDKTPFVEVQPEPAEPRKTIRFGVFREYEIPVSLAVLSYLYFLPAGLCFAYLTFFVCLLVFSGGGGSALSGFIILGCAACGAIGLFFVCLSRGLRRCSRGWRTCALVFIWWGFIAGAFSIGQFLLTHKTPTHEMPTVFLAGSALGFIVQIWQYRVLTRPDIRDLFGV